MRNLGNNLYIEPNYRHMFGHNPLYSIHNRSTMEYLSRNKNSYRDDYFIVSNEFTKFKFFNDNMQCVLFNGDKYFYIEIDYDRSDKTAIASLFALSHYYNPESGWYESGDGNFFVVSKAPSSQFLTISTYDVVYSRTSRLSKKRKNDISSLPTLCEYDLSYVEVGDLFIYSDTYALVTSYEDCRVRFVIWKGGSIANKSNINPYSDTAFITNGKYDQYKYSYHTTFNTAAKSGILEDIGIILPDDIIYNVNHLPFNRLHGWVYDTEPIRYHHMRKLSYEQLNCFLGFE